MLIINFEGREAKGLSEGRYDETFAGEDAIPRFKQMEHFNKLACPAVLMKLHTEGPGSS